MFPCMESILSDNLDQKRAHGLSGFAQIFSVVICGICEIFLKN